MEIFFVGFDAATALTGAISPAHSQPAPAWPMFRPNPRHNDASAFPVLPDHISLAWSYTTADDIASSSAIDGDDKIYLGSRDNTICAPGAAGVLSWSYSGGTGAADDVISSPLVGSARRAVLRGRFYLLGAALA